MNSSLAAALSWLSANPSLLAGMRRGLEKESLRVTPKSQLAQTPHATSLGSALTHPWITTDYSESLIELITPATTSIQETLGWLDNIHRFVFSQMGDETLWANSMPCILGDANSIPLAQYGSSNIGRMKTLYRRGLGVRYGRHMQTIAGIHYNLSFPDAFFQAWQEKVGDTRSLETFRSEKYFDLVRNFQRQSWMLLYLLGASPAVCSSFLQGRQHQLQHCANDTLFLPLATSLRMSSLGYQNNVQSDLHVSYNTLEEYVHDLNHAIQTPYDGFEKIGLKDNHGDYQQITTNILQIENEYYGLVRPKRTTLRGERPTTALSQRGVEYVELRCVDLNPFSPIGIDESSAHFLEVFALHCLLKEAPPFLAAEYSCLPKNQQLVVEQGRNPNLVLRFCGHSERLPELAHHIMDELAQIAPLLDAAYNTTKYSAAITEETEKLDDPERTLSAQVIRGIKAANCSFVEYTQELSDKNRAYFLSRPLEKTINDEFVSTAARSHHDQAQIEHSDTLSFPDFLTAYFQQ